MPPDFKLRIMSLLGKKWVIKNADDELNTIAKLLKNRGVDSPEKAEWFFNATLKEVHDPMLLTDMEKAVGRIKKAIEAKEKIMIFGDYDADGITATAVLYDFFKKIDVDAHYTLPSRDGDGYGLKDYFIKRFKEMGVGLMITVDCGTANFKEVELANELGIDVIITDHHSMPKELPNAYAVINPKRPDCNYPNKEICGAAIAYKVITALAPSYLPADEADAYLKKQLGLVAMGLVSDCMEMTGENRIIVREGLKSLTAGSHPGVTKLLQEAGLSVGRITSTTIGFQIGPRINAAGRLDKPDHALELLIGNLEKVVTLNSLNEKRRTLSRQCIDEAMAMVEEMSELPSIIVLKSKEWKAGLLGLIASGVADRYNRPTIAIQEMENEMVASMRSVNNFDITSCLRTVAVELFIAFGGHAMAGGFTLPNENYEEFLSRTAKAGKEQIKPEEFVGTLEIDCEIKPEEMNFETCGKMTHLEPHGAKNPIPILLIKNVTIQKIRQVGKDAEHLQFTIQFGGESFKAIAFRFAQHLDKINSEVPNDIVFNMEVNEWKGTKNLQLRVMDLKPTE